MGLDQQGTGINRDKGIGNRKMQMGTKKGAEWEKGGQDEAAQILVESHVGCQSFQLTGPSP